MTPAGWRTLFAGAHTHAEIVAMAIDFVAAFPPEELQQLSPSCQPPPFTCAEDITSYAYILVRSNCQGDARIGILAHRFVAFFSEASIRLGELRPGSPAPRQDARHPA